MNSIFKWAGGKKDALKYISIFFDKSKKRLVEPFVGGGSVFMNLEYDSYLLADINPDLINFYKRLQIEKQDFLNLCKNYFNEEFNNKETYISLRKEFNKTKKEELFLYLNRHCYNGLCRYNLKKEFNVPFGKYKNPYFPEQEMKFFIKNRAQKCEFICKDFKEVFKMIKENDIVYADSPYLPLSKTADFTTYYGLKFTHQDHSNLATLAQECQAQILLSNHATIDAKKLYKNANKLFEYSLNRKISCKNRNKANELLVIFE